MTDYTKLVKALRHVGICQDCNECEAGRWHNEFDCCLFKDAADAIEALQAQLPKLGEWQKAKPHGVVTYSDGYAECSHCHEAIWLGWGMNFCPNCGTQNKIIDPDDYDGAKMDGPIITPCRGCSDYDGYGGCKSKGECARKLTEVQE